MRITKQEIKQIIDEQLLFLVEQEVEAASVPEPPKAGNVDITYLNKQLLIAATYYQSVLSKIIRLSFKDQKQHIEQTLKAPYIKRIDNIVDSIIMATPLGKQEDETGLQFLLSKKTYTPEQVIHNSAVALHQLPAFFGSLIKLPEATPEATPDQANVLGKSYGSVEKWLSYVTNIIEKLNSNIAISPKIGSVFTSRHVDNQPIHIAKYLKQFSNFERIASQYIHEIEILFQKVNSIGIDIIESLKTDEDYELTKPRAQLWAAIQKEEEGYSQDGIQNKKNKTSNLRDLHSKMAYPKVNPSPKFSKKMFMSALYNPTAARAGKTTDNRVSGANKPVITAGEEGKNEIEKAEAITYSVEQVNALYESIRSTFFKSTRDFLYAKDTNTSAVYKTAIKKLTVNIEKAYDIYKGLMKNFLNLLDKKDSEISHMFKTDALHFATGIKFMQFLRIDNRQLFLALVSNKDEMSKQDVYKLAGEYSEERQAKINERLRYWHLFKKLGWTSEDAPVWIYTT